MGGNQKHQLTQAKNPTKQANIRNLICKQKTGTENCRYINWTLWRKLAFNQKCNWKIQTTYNN